MRVVIVLLLLCGTVFHESFRAFGFTITTTKKISDKDLLQSAIKYASNGDYQSAQSNLDKVLSQNPQNVDATQLLGVVKYQQGQTSEALQLLQRALDLDRYQNLGIVANYIEILRASGNLQLASDAGHKALASIDPSRFPDCKVIFFNLAVVEMNLGHSEVAVGLYERALDIDPYLLKAWHYVAEVKAKSAPAEAESVLLKALTFFPDDHTLHFLLGTVYQMQHRLVEALQSYLVAEKLDDQAYNLKGNIASVLQSLGRAEEALVYYQRALPHCTDDAGLYNNYGALLGIMGKYDEELRWLTKALEINPFLGPALVNLAGYYQDEGDLGKARELIKRAAAPEAVYSNGARTAGSLFRIREALMLSPVAATWEQMLSERTSIMRCLQALVDEATRGPAPEKVDVDTSLDRIHFYVSYHGLNDRALQDLVMRLYHLHLRIQYRSPHVLPLAQAGFPGWIQPTASALPSPTLTPPSPVLPSAAQMSLVSLPLPRRARIGFLSKFFGIFEPHGMLLDGVMRYLPRDRFEVLALPVARGDGKPLSPAIASSCDAVHQVSLSYEHAQQMLQELRLDVLVFADTVSEPMTHFLAHSRLAPIQMVFWGNPITTGSHEIDYFISADVMEHPHRTRMPVAHEPYTEQVVLMEGQGIWYLRPDIEGDLINSDLKDKVAPTRTYARADFGLQEGWFLYVLPQSTFKIHPLYDLVLRDILQRAPQAHLVVTGGRRPRWTQIYKTRLQTALGPELSQRLHMMSRVSSEQFPALLEIADVILHPFPFDGSKTSADALYVHKPIVTLPTEYLRGRMGAAFLRTMNLPELVARSRSEYVEIAVRLSFDRAFYDLAVGVIKETVDLIWEDMEVPFTWSNLLCGIIGVPAPSWDAFLAQTGRDVAEEQRRSARRNRNARAFDARWGPETWLLQDGVAALETTLDGAQQVPCIFRDWECTASDAVAVQTPVQDRPAVTDQPPPAVEMSADKLSELAARRTQYLDLAFVGQFAEALSLALSLDPYIGEYPLYLAEVGLIYLFMGEHRTALDYCSRAAEADSEASLVLGCFGLASIYLPVPAEETIRTLLKALELQQGEQQRIAQYLANAYPSAASMDEAEVEAAAGVLSSPAFLLNKAALETNLLTAYSLNGLNRQCLDWFVHDKGLPPLELGAAYILLFSAVDWSDGARGDVVALEAKLRMQGRYVAAAGESLWDAMRRLQRQSSATLSIAMGCSHGLREDAQYQPQLNEALQEFSVLIQKREAASVPIAATPSFSAQDGDDVVGPVTTRGVVLVLQFFASADDAKTQDINVALWRNLQNDFVTDIYLLNEELMSFRGFPNAHKIHQIVIGERLTFQRAFAFANEHLQGRTVILANSDIFFDGTLFRLSGADDRRVPPLRETRTVLALLKWFYYSADDSMSITVRTDSQDAWVFQPPVSAAALAELDFYMGLPRCDNRLVYVLQQHNYTVLDPAFAVHALELDSIVRTERIYNTKHAVVGNVASLPLSDRFEF